MMSSSEMFSCGKGSVVLTDNPSGNPEALVEGRRVADRQTAAEIVQKEGRVCTQAEVNGGDKRVG